MHITFIHPIWERSMELYDYSNSDITGKLSNYANLSIPTIAAYFKDDADIEFVSEFYEDINYKTDTDYVFITFFTPQASRAYEIADEYKKIGVKTIAGGIHPSVLPNEAKMHFDSVVVGEMEPVVGQLLLDMKAGMLKKTYQSTNDTNLDAIKFPVRNLYKKYGAKMVQPLQTSRGCYIPCPTCVIPDMYGKKIRFKSPEVVDEELSFIDDKVIYFVDDHLVWGNLSYAKDIFNLIKKHNKLFVIGGAPSMLTPNPGYLKMAYDSGCRYVYAPIGFDKETNRGLYKNYNKTLDQIKIIRDSGIFPILNVIFGLEHDDESVFDMTLKFCDDAGIDVADFSVICPFPGSPSFNKMKRDGRILTEEWSQYNYMHVVFEPKLMSVDALEKGFRNVVKEFCDRRSMDEDYTPEFLQIARLLDRYISPFPEKLA